MADSFEVMTATRSYKKPMSLQDARAELTRCAGSHFSPEVVRAFLQISLGHLRIVSGPLAALAHLPFLGNLAQLPAAAAAAAPGLSAVPAAAMMSAAALVVAPPVPAPAAETVATAEAPAVGATTGPALAADADPAAPTTAPTTTTVSAPAVGGVGAAAGVQIATTTTVAAVPTTTTTTAVVDRRPATTTSAAPATTAAPTVTVPTTIPATTVPSPSSTSPPTTASATFAILYATNNLRLPASNLHGASVVHGTKIYVYAPVSSVSRVDFTYPGGTRRAESFPYDMRGGSLTAESWTVPSTPGTYSITASASGGSGAAGGPVTATFTVT